MKIGSNRDINRNHKKLTPPDVPNTMIPAARRDPVGTTVLQCNAHRKAQWWKTSHYTFDCRNWFVRETLMHNIFTAKISRIILNGKPLLYSGSSWVFWLRSDGLRIASKIMPRTFWSTTQSNNAQSTERTKGEQSTNAKLEKNSVLGTRNKRLERWLQLSSKLAKL